MSEQLLLIGDCLDKMWELHPSSVDMVLADMPYGTTACKWDTVIPFGPMWDHIKRVSKPNAAIVLTAQTPFDKVLGASNLPMLRYEWIWEKTTATGHLNAEKAPMKAHENVLVFYQKPPTYHPQKTTGHAPANGYTKRNGDGDCYGATSVVSGGGQTDRYPRSVQVFKSDKQKSSEHSTQKPLALMEYLIKTYTDSGDAVLDFAMGSGTTGVACSKLDRQFIGIEKDPHIFAVAQNRIISTSLPNGGDA